MMIKINDEFELHMKSKHGSGADLIHTKCGKLVQCKPFYTDHLYTVCGCKFRLTPELVNRINFIIGVP